MFKFIIFILASLMSASCSSSRSIESRLHDAESLMDEHPDSALAIIQTVNPEDITSARTKALYALLSTQILDKNYIDVLSDSTINIAVDFFEKTSDHPRLMCALYYQGNALYNQGAYPESITSLFRAYNLARKLSDNYWIAMTASKISDIYHHNFNGTEEVSFSKIAYDNFIFTGKTDHIIYSLIDLGRAYMTVDKYDKCILIAKQIKDSAALYKSPHITAESIRLEAIANLGKGNYTVSAGLYSTLCKTPYANATDSAYYGLAELYDGNIAASRSIFQKLSPSSSNAYVSLNYQLALASGSMKEALRCRSNMDIKTDSMLRFMVKSNLSGALLKYHSYENQLAEAKLSEARMLTFIIILITLLSIIAGVIMFMAIRHRLKKKNLIIKHNLIIAKNLESIISDQAKESREIIDALMNDRFKEINTLCKKLYDSRQNPKTVIKKISEITNSFILSFSTDPKKISELEILANSHHNNIVADFYADFSNLKESDKMLFLFSILGFSNVAITLFLQLRDITLVYDRRRHLKDKIKCSDCINKQKYLDYL